MKKILTIILDGFSIKEKYGPEEEITPCLKSLWDNYPHSVLSLNSDHHKLDQAYIHKLIGSGRLLKKDSVIVNDFLDEGYKDNEDFEDLLAKKNKRVHLILLMSPDANESNIKDFLKINSQLINRGFKNIFIHIIISDQYKTIDDMLEDYSKIEQEINVRGIGTIASIIGENYKTESYADLLSNGKGASVLDLQRALTLNYDKNQSFGNLKPIVLSELGTIKSNDIVLVLNYETRNITNVIKQITINRKDIWIYSLFDLDEDLKRVYFLERDLPFGTIGKCLSELEISQARIGSATSLDYIAKYIDRTDKLDYCEFEVINPANNTLNNYLIATTKKCVAMMEKDVDFIIAEYDLANHPSKISLNDKIKLQDKCIELLTKVASENFYKMIIVSSSVINNGILPIIFRDKKLHLESKGDITSFMPTLFNYIDIAVPKEMEKTSTLIK